MRFLQLARDDVEARLSAAGLPRPDFSPGALPSTNYPAQGLPQIYDQEEAKSGRSGPNQQGCLSQGVLNANQNGPGGRHSTRARSRAKADEELPSRVPEPTLPGDGTTRAGNSPARRGGGKVRACAHCGATAEMLENGKLLECTACRSVRYCGKACQKEDWPLHKATCKHRRAAQK